MSAANEESSREAATLSAGLEGANETIWPRAYQTQCEAQDGYRIIHGCPHGFNWKNLYRVTVEFESAEEAREFFDSLHEGGIVPSNASHEGPDGSGGTPL